MGWWSRLAGKRDDTASPLYAAIVAEARQPHWYQAGAVPDTIDGRFDMVAAVLSLVLLRLEQDPAAAEASARLTERFIDDMDGQLREIGVGDVVVGKHVGRMMSMLGGRLGAYRDGLAAGSLHEPLVRNLYRGQAPAADSVAHVERALLALRDGLAARSTAEVEAGAIA